MRPVRTNATRLLVCEGDAEIEFSRVVRELYLPRGCGVSLTARNRRGFGGAAALRMAIEEKRRGGFDRYGVLIDTDSDWSAVDKATAIRNQIVAIECAPCIEAILLDVKGLRVYAVTADNKRAFRQAFGDAAHRQGLIARNFSKADLDGARNRIGAIDTLLTFVNP